MRPPDFWSQNDPAANTIAAALSPLGLVYGASVAWKHRFASPYRARAAVVCIGNLTVGGTGKTPLTIAVARALAEQGVPVACLARGYGRRSAFPMLVDANLHDAGMVGDEALLLAQSAPTVVARDRAEGARLAVAHGARAIVMDDGHQNFALAKDLSLVAVDGEAAFGNGRIIPAGPLRESVAQGLRRADALVVMGAGDPALPRFAGPILRARLAGERRFDGRRVTAFAGIGRPAKFFDSLRAAGAEIVQCHSYGDHHVYSESEIAALRNAAKRADSILVTTEKDFVRLSPAQREGVDMLPVRAVFDDASAFAQLIDSLLAKSPGGSAAL
jgi:tetraacyldisaccharide 4'-kinase